MGGTEEQFREYDLPAKIRPLRLPSWLVAFLGAVLLSGAAAAVAGSILINDRDSTVIPARAEGLILGGALTLAFLGTLMLRRAGDSVTLTADAALVTKAFVARVRIERAQIQDFHAYLHKYATRGGTQYRMVPTFTVLDAYDQLRDVTLPFLAYWSPEGGTQAPLPPRAAYVDAWARAGSNPYSRAALVGVLPPALELHRQYVRTGLLRRARLAAVFIPLLAIGLGLCVGFGLGPVSKAIGPVSNALGIQTRSFDANTDRAGIRDLDDSLTPAMTGYQWRAQKFAHGVRTFSFFPTLRSLPSAPYTVCYFIRDPAQRSSGLSVSEQRYGRIVARGTISAERPVIGFALDDDDQTFAFEVYVTDNQGHTTFDSDLYRNIAASPGPQSAGS